MKETELLGVQHPQLLSILPGVMLAMESPRLSTGQVVLLPMCMWSPPSRWDGLCKNQQRALWRAAAQQAVPLFFPHLFSFGIHVRRRHLHLEKQFPAPVIWFINSAPALQQVSKASSRALVGDRVQKNKCPVVKLIVQANLPLKAQNISGQVSPACDL